MGSILPPYFLVSFNKLLLCTSEHMFKIFSSPIGQIQQPDSLFKLWRDRKKYLEPYKNIFIIVRLSNYIFWFMYSRDGVTGLELNSDR